MTPRRDLPYLLALVVPAALLGLTAREPTAARPANGTPCEGCHPHEAERWRGSHHALADRLPDAPELTSALGGSKHLTVPTAAGPRRYPVTRVLGVHPLWQPVLQIEDGLEQVYEQAWDVERGQWFLAFDGPRAEGSWGHWRGRGMTFATMCAECHETDFDRGYDPESDRFLPSQRARGVRCEACHGGSEAHVRDPTVPPARVRPGADTCGPCHSRRATLTATPAPDAADPMDRYLLLTASVPGLYYPDGQVKDEVFEYASFLGSRMHDRGVTCATCHEPHTGALRSAPNALCRGCHEAQPEFQEHGHHPEGGATCVDCHMPSTVYMQRHPRRDHGFTIPDPALTSEFGVPNACNRCHEDRDPAWAQSRLHEWFGPSTRPASARARVLARLARGDEAAVRPALTLLGAETNDYQRSVILGGLVPWASRADVRDRLLESARDPAPLVRVQAAEGLGRLADGAAQAELLRLAKDPRRAVRVTAQRALAPRFDPGSPSMRDFSEYLDANADQPSAARARGRWLLSRGDRAEALEWFERANRWDPPE